MSAQVLSAVAQGEGPGAAGGFPHGAPWPGGHTEGLPCSPLLAPEGYMPAQPRSVSWPVGSGHPGPCFCRCGLQTSRMGITWVLAPRPNVGPTLRTGLNAGPGWDSNQDHRGKPPGGPVIRTPRSPTAEGVRTKGN